MFQFLASVLGSPSKSNLRKRPGPKPTRSRFLPMLDLLEEREVMTGGVLHGQVLPLASDLAYGTLKSGVNMDMNVMSHHSDFAYGTLKYGVNMIGNDGLMSARSFSRDGPAPIFCPCAQQDPKDIVKTETKTTYKDGTSVVKVEVKNKDGSTTTTTTTNCPDGTTTKELENKNKEGETTKKTSAKYDKKGHKVEQTLEEGGKTTTWKKDGSGTWEKTETKDGETTTSTSGKKPPSDVWPDKLK